jgi:hypothetical protein
VSDGAPGIRFRLQSVRSLEKRCRSNNLAGWLRVGLQFVDEDEGNGLHQLVSQKIVRKRDLVALDRRHICLSIVEPDLFLSSNQVISIVDMDLCLSMMGCCIDDLMEQLDRPGFRHDVGTELARRQRTRTSSKPMIRDESEESASDDDDTDFATIRRSVPRASPTPRAEPKDSDDLEEPPRKKKRCSKNCPVDLSMDSDPNSHLYRNFQLEYNCGMGHGRRMKRRNSCKN